jgi:poly(3-hydroxybutyrate) depolymerase
MILELEKMTGAYQTNTGEFERIKLELSNCKGENAIWKVQIDRGGHQSGKVTGKALNFGPNSLVSHGNLSKNSRV